MTRSGLPERIFIAPSDPAENFSGMVLSITSGSHAGEKEILLDKLPTVG